MGRKSRSHKRRDVVRNMQAIDDSGTGVLPNPVSPVIPRWLKKALPRGINLRTSTSNSKIFTTKV